jgi:hypothetical protein
MQDPMESLIATALENAGITFTTGEGGKNPTGLDFGLSNGVQIEVKRFHSARIAEQMSRAENVIAAQGVDAVVFLAGAISAIGANQTAEVQALRADNDRLRKAAQRALDESVADGLDPWFADLRAALDARR